MIAPTELAPDPLPRGLGEFTAQRDGERPRLREFFHAAAPGKLGGGDPKFGAGGVDDLSDRDGQARLGFSALGG